MSRVRRDVAKLGTGWNDSLLWYAKAIIELDKLSIDNRRSWRFLAAIHGFAEDTWHDYNLYRPGETTPQEYVNGTYGRQCRHGEWYFLPWHRGYLAAFEAIVADQIKSMGGPEDWALPYWNYLETGNPDAKRYPDAFLDPTLPDGRNNPLSAPPRRNTNILVSPAPTIPNIHLKAMTEPFFEVNPDGTIGFGGTAFAAGDLELNPHNPVHVIVGGPGGYMYDPDLAGLDPIFWIHHCNIDRLWEAWMRSPGRTMVTESRWKNGPTQPRFQMPPVSGGNPPTFFAPRDTLRGGKFYPTYDDLTAGTGVVPAGGGAIGVTMGTTRSQTIDVLGATNGPVTVGADAVHASVELDPGPAADAVRAMGPIDAEREVSRLYLQLENVRGSAKSAVVDVFVNLPEGADPAESGQYRADSLYLFGLARASDPDESHAGNGLGMSIDITDLAARLAEEGLFDPAHLDVAIFPIEGASAEAPVTFERVSVLRRRVAAPAP